ncbi:MAG: hypothetical protein SGPRY_006521 [Prymnesium sp.]
MPRPKALLALRYMCSLPPLRMSAVEFDACAISLHSQHGTGSDMLRFMGASCAFTELGEQVAFDERDARAIGHWLRGKSAPAEVLPSGQGDPRRAGAPNQRLAMNFRYSQGRGRRGGRQEQLQLRWRLISHVRLALQRYGRPWWTLPRSLASCCMVRAPSSIRFTGGRIARFVARPASVSGRSPRPRAGHQPLHERPFVLWRT